MDGVDWLHWTKVNGASTPSKKVTNLTVQQLDDIYNGTDYNWAQVGRHGRTDHRVLGPGGLWRPVDVDDSNGQRPGPERDQL